MSSLVLPPVIGHRGAAAMAPENTLAGFACAAACGAAWVELDVQLSGDGVPVVFHDDRLERTSSGRGRVVETPAAELARLDAGSWFGQAFAGERIPTLMEALEAIAGLGLGVNIEVKADEADGARTAAVSLALAVRHWPVDRVPPLVSSFAVSALAAAAEVVPRWPRGLLLAGWPPDWQKLAGKLGCVSVNVDQRRLTAPRARAVKTAGLGLLAYTVNDAERARQLWEWGADGVFTDDPQSLLKARRSNL